jgi:hypothetical protein
MARDYILRESATQRKALIELVVASLIRVVPFTGPGVGISLGIGEEKADYRADLIRKLVADVPLSDIPEFERWLREDGPRFEEVERERGEWREVGSYKTAIKRLANEILNQEIAPTESQCRQLVEVVKRCPLLAEESSASLEDIRCICSRHPWLNHTISMIIGHLRFIEFATPEQRPYFINRIWKAWSKSNSKEPDLGSAVDNLNFADFDTFIANLSKPEPFDYDEPPIVFFENMQFHFSGRFKFGTRKACGEAVTNLGGVAMTNANRWVDYLVIASGGENTSPSSSSCAPITKWRARGWPCFVITEELWTRSLKATV